MLQVLNAGNEIFFNLVSGLFGTVAKIYDIMLKLVQENGMRDYVQLDDISTTIYVLAGVFMLFRVVISMIQMLINPDQMTDKNAGAGKLVIRVITCIVMLMVFVPNGLVFGKNGILPRLESALLADDGLVTRIGNIGGEIEQIQTGSTSKKNTTGNKTNNSSSTKKADLTCYYINEEHQGYEASYKGRKTVTINSMYKVEFYKGSGGKNTIAGTNYTYTDRSGQRIAGKDNNGTYAQLPSPISQGNVFNEGDFSRCPKSFNQGDVYLISNRINQTAGIKGGWTSLSDVASYLKTLKRSNDYLIDTDVPFIRTSSETNKKYTSGSSAESVAFSQKTASTLQECVEDKADECEEAQSMMFVTLDGDKAIVNLMDSGDLKVDLFLSVIAGLGLVGYLLLLCVEVIIREFKLYLLKMIAPIAIISHVDPKDKIFGQWAKMLVSVYVDLFIKLISIGFAITLLDRVMESFKAADGGLLVKFFYIVAILAFAKIVPTMISKIFGIDSLGGSFKDIGKIAKTAAGFGAGAIVGGAVGAMTGKGAGRFSGFAKGALMGAGSGSKGKLTAGAQGIASKNAAINKQKAEGLNFFDRMAIGAYNATGVTPSGKEAEEKMKMASEVVSKQSDLKKYGTDELKKKGATFVAGRVNNGQGIISKDKKRVVANANENINMKEEYKKQENLAQMSMKEWGGMSVADREREFGYSAVYDEYGNERSLSSAQLFQNDRVAALEDYGVAIRINESLGQNDAEAIRKVNDLRSAISDARNAGLEDIAQVPDTATYTNTTLKNAKDQGNATYNKVEQENIKNLKRNKYVNNK